MTAFTYLTGQQHDDIDEAAESVAFTGHRAVMTLATYARNAEDVHEAIRCITDAISICDLAMQSNAPAAKKVRTVLEVALVALVAKSDEIFHVMCTAHLQKEKARREAFDAEEALHDVAKRVNLASG